MIISVKNIFVTCFDSNILIINMNESFEKSYSMNVIYFLISGKSLCFAIIINLKYNDSHGYIKKSLRLRF